MKFNSKIDKKFFACFNEASGVAMAKRKILRTRNCSCNTYLENVILIFLVLLLLGCSGISFHCLAYFWVVLVLAVIHLFVSCFFILRMAYYNNRLEKYQTVIDKKGITNDAYYDIKMLFSWELIQAIVIKDHSITILTKTPCYFFFDIKYKEEIIKLLQKYEKEELLISE